MPHLNLHFRPMHLFLDFDSTLTTHDTLAHLAAIGYSRRNSTITPTQSLRPWSQISTAYTTDYAAHTKSYIPPPPLRTTLVHELTFLASLHSVEEASVRRVEEAGIFHGVTGQDIHVAAREAVRSGGREKGRVGVVSVNWSMRWVRECLAQGVRGVDSVEKESHEGEKMQGRGGLEAMVRAMPIVANEIEDLDSTTGSSGLLSRYFVEQGGIWTAADKARVLRKLIREGKGTERTVYVGDSLTDLECLALVDVGICIRDERLASGQEALKEAMERVGVECRSIGEMRDGAEAGIWWATGFEEIAKSVLFLEYRNGAG